MNEYFKLNINGYDQQVWISGNEEKPILLFCHGGPGTPTMSLLRTLSRPLFEDFLVVTWDQRGTGRSFTKDLDVNTININTIARDAHCLTSYILDRFNREKIYIMGHSFGATLAMKVIKEHPEHYSAYFAISQFVNSEKNELACYNFVCEQAKKQGHDNILKKLAALGAPVQGFYKRPVKDMMYVKRMVSKYKGDARNGQAASKIVTNILFSKEYGFFRAPNTIKGIGISLEKAGLSLKGIAYDRTHKKLDIPVYFFSGDYDRLTPQEILRDYYKTIEAPHKELHLFHESAHSPLWEEPEKFHSIIKEILKHY